MKVSIIIPVKRINNYIRESLPYLKNLDYENYEVLILPDYSDEQIEGVKIIETGSIGPAQKRDIGAEKSSGDILAFLDDDAYPRKDWLLNAVRHFSNPKIGAVGGPGVTPKNNCILQKASGNVLSSKIGGGNMTYRYVPGKVRYVDDFPSVNFLIRKDLFLKMGGFDTQYWPGEDTKLCHDLVNLGYKIIYDPEVFVYHHRRKLFLPHLKQITNYAQHRGFFVKKFPKTSLRIGYFIPSGLVIFILGSLMLSIFNKLFLLPLFAVLSIYILLVMLSGLKNKDIRSYSLYVWGIILTHLGYGIYFLRGLFSRRMST